jgi:hypothetical protein
MSLLLWVSLAFLGAVATGGSVLVVVRAIDLYRATRSFGQVIAGGADRILNAAESAEQRVTRASPDRLAAPAGRLETSLATARTLLREGRRVRASVAGVRASVPRK